MSVYKVQSPVLFIIFNRPDTTAQVFEQIRRVQPSRLYIAADGPRLDKENESNLCEQTRMVIKLVDWDCEVKTLFRDENLGCKDAPASAITWFFEQEEEGIILEDDCLPANDFFRFCDILLKKYRYDTRIRTISGTNYQHGQVWGAASYYFSNLTHIWGWASWRRVWNDYDKNLKAYQAADAYKQFLNVFGETILAKDWIKILADLQASKIDTWDYQLSIINYFNNGLSIIPNVNLISNIGFGEGATHTTNKNDINACLPAGSIEEIIHPLYIVPEKGADLYTMDIQFSISARKIKERSIKKRIKKFFNNIFVTDFNK